MDFEPTIRDATIRDATLSDSKNIAEIYNHYIIRTVVSFEIEPVTEDEIADRLRAVRDSALPWLVLDSAEGMLGYAYARPWNPRGAYRYSVESSVYLDHRHTGRGSGSRLYEALIDRLRTLGIHSVIGGITLPNEPSVALHEKFGFEKSAHYREVGFKQDRWIDVGYWQCILEGSGEVPRPT